MTARLVVVEDHGLLAETVGAALRTRGHQVEVVAVTSRADPADAVLRHGPDLVLLDLDLGEGRADGEQACVRLAKAGLPVLMVTGVTDPVRLARCVRAGAVGIVDKGAPFGELARAVDTVLQAGSLVDGHERQEHLALLRRHESAEALRLAPFRALTPREAEVLRALCEGQLVDDIARDATVSASTVRSQVRAILRKLGVSSQLAATALAHRSGWLDRTE